MLRVVYLGLPLGALTLARAGFSPVIVGVHAVDAPGMRRVRRRLAADGRTLVLGRPDLERPEVQALVTSARPDVLLSWFYPRRIPAALLHAMPRGAFGVHPSLLPRWRGPDPYFWALRAGDAETGVTLHRLEEEYDTGEVIERRALPIADADDAWTLARRLDRPSLALLVACAGRLARGEALAGTRQDEALVREAPQPTEEALVIDFKAPTLDVLRLVRAAAPHPGATCLLGDTLVSVLRAGPAPDAPRALLPGEAAVLGGRVVVKTGDGGVALLRVRVEESDALEPGRELRGADVAPLLTASPTAR